MWRALGLLLILLLPYRILAAQPAQDDVIPVALQTVQAGAASTLQLNLHFPPGYHLNPRAPFLYTVRISGPGLSIAEADRQRELIAPTLPLVIPFQTTSAMSQATLDIATTFYYCREDDTGVCVMQDVRWQVPVQVTPAAPSRDVLVSYQAEVPVVQKE
jgi:hypothetical protein